MRNSEARMYARWSLAAAAVLAAVVAGVYGRSVWLAKEAEKKAPPSVPPSIEQRSNEFAYSKVEGQKTIYTVRASRATEFKEGNRNLLEDVSIVVYGKKGDRNDQLRTKACDFISNTGKISCAGEVQMTLQAAGAPANSPNTVQVITSAVVFDRDSGVARTDKPVQFRWTGGDGSAVGVSYDSNEGALDLRHNVELNLSLDTPPADGKAPSNPSSPEKMVHVAGDALSYQHDIRQALMTGHVHAQQLTHELYADRLQMDLDEELRAQRLVATGHPQMRDLSPQGPLSLAADEIDSKIRSDGSIDSVVATGNVHGTRTTAVGSNTIEAGRVQVDLATTENVPRLLTASQNVVLTATGAAFNEGTRRMQSDAIEVHFSPDSRPGQNLVESVNTLAPAQVDWQNVAMVNGNPVPQATRMNGRRMTLKFDGQNELQQLVSNGDVEVRRKLGQDPDQVTNSRELVANFDKTGEWTTVDQTGDVHFHDDLHTGRADVAHMDRPTNTLNLSGGAVFEDANTRTTAETASYVQASNSVHADGHVVTTDLHPSAASISNAEQQPAHITAEHLVADTAKGHAVYSGKGRLWQGQSIIEAETIELDNPTQVLVAKGQVRGIFPQAPWSPTTAEPSATEPPKAAPKPPKPSKPQQSKPSSQTSARAPGQHATPATQLGHVSGGMLTYWENESRARVEQNARVDSDQGSIQADRIDLFFSDAGSPGGTKQLSRSVALGDVKVHQEDRRGTSERAEYTAAEGKFVLSEGKPTLYNSSGDTTTGRQLTFYFADDRIVVDSADGTKTVTLHQVEK